MNNSETNELIKSVDWFKHYTSQSTGLTLLERKLGFTGLGRYWRLLEIAGSSEFHAIPPRDNNQCSVIAMALGFDTGEELEEFIIFLNSLGLVDLDKNGFRRFQSLEDAAQRIEVRKKSGSKGGKTKAENMRKKAECNE